MAKKSTARKKTKANEIQEQQAPVEKIEFGEDGLPKYWRKRKNNNAYCRRWKCPKVNECALGKVAHVLSCLEHGPGSANPNDNDRVGDT